MGKHRNSPDELDDDSAVLKAARSPPASRALPVAVGLLTVLVTSLTIYTALLKDERFAIRRVENLPLLDLATFGGRVSAPVSSGGADALAREEDEDEIPQWRSTEDDTPKFVAAIVAPEDPKRAEFWTRTSRLWRRDIPAVVMTIGEASAEALAEGKEYGEEWVTWRGADNYYVGKETSLLAMAPALAGQALERFDYDWLLLGVEGTVFNLDTLAQQIRGFDPTLPVMVTDHLWFSYQGSGPRPIERHGSPHAPRCIKCPVHGRKKIPGINWRPTHGCPYCTFAVLKKWDEERPELYNGTNDYKPQLGPEGHLYAYVEGGMVLSRELVRLLNATAVDRCLRNDLARHPTVSGAVALSHCIFSMGIPATDPGPFALDPSFGAFAPLHYGVGDVVRDSRNFARGPDCCDERCEHRLATTASLYIPINDAVNKFKVREAVRALQRARDVFRAARRAETAVGGQIVRGRGAGWCM